MNIDNYLKLITSEHSARPKYMAFVRGTLRPLCDLQEFLETLRRAFDLDSACGVQLDAVGEWVGRSRYLKTPLAGVFFSWNEDEAPVGWGEGLWKGKFDADKALYALPDDLYRTLLRAKIAANSWNGTIPAAYEALEIAFGAGADKGGSLNQINKTGTLLIIQDNGDMSLTIGLAGRPPSVVMQELLVQGYLPLKPEGVRIKHYVITPRLPTSKADGEGNEKSEGGGPLFAWNCNSEALQGFDTGVFGLYF